MPAFPTGGDTPWEKWKAFAIRRRTCITLAAAIPVLAVAEPTLPWYLGGLAVVALGVCVRLIASGYITKSTELATNGPFAVTRHPLYLGGALVAAGFCAMTGAWYSFLSVVVPIGLLYAAVYGPTIVFEERFMVERFGEDYRAYCRRVPRFLPRLRVAPYSWRGFSWDRVRRNHELTNIAGVAAFAVAFALMFLR
ncbi:MAG: methyltransferase family protein [Armatimonadota bacterium]